jgi:ribonucleoside-diphosphate reductase beta chain
MMLGLPAIHRVDDHPLPWLAPLINGVEHANPITLSLSEAKLRRSLNGETRATEYSKAATKGNWQDVWASFDQRQRAKGSAANEAEDEGPGLFGDAGGAAQAAE